MRNRAKLTRIIFYINLRQMDLSKLYLLTKMHVHVVLCFNFTIISIILFSTTSFLIHFTKDYNLIKEKFERLGYFFTIIYANFLQIFRRIIQKLCIQRLLLVLNY